MGITEALVVISVILVVVDMFFTTDIPTYVAFCILSYVLAREIPLPILYQVLAGILIWWALFAVNLFLRNKFIHKFVDKFLAPDKYKAGVNDFLGRRVKVKIVEGQSFVCVNGDLWSLDEELSDSNLQEGEEVMIADIRSTQIVVRRIAS